MKIDEIKCIGCCSCKTVCPQQAITFLNGKCYIDTKECINCGTCVNMCPMSAINNE